MATADWSGAPADVLWRIIEHLPIADYIRFGAVCLSWRAVLAEKQHPPAPIPWLLLPDYSYKGTLSPIRCFSLSDNKEYRLELPHILQSLTCIGSSHGWLLFMNRFSGEESEICMFNPFSRDLAVLPSIATLPGPDVDLLRLDPEGSIQFQNSRKVVVSPYRSSNFMASAIKLFARSLAFAREGDKSWAMIETPGNHQFSDIIFHKEKYLCGLTRAGCAIVCDLSDLSPPRVAFVVQPPALDYGRSLKYLVESAGELMLVWRGLREEIEGGILPVWMGMTDEEIQGGFATTAIRVLKLVKADNKVQWVEQKSLADHALFLGHNPSLSLCTRDVSELPRNCVFLSNISRVADSGGDLSLYQMQERSLEPLLSLCRTKLECPWKLERPRMYWFIPKLTPS